MYAAQEMFKTANKVTRPEKALILGFMAGSRGIILLLFKQNIAIREMFGSVIVLVFR